MHLSNIEIYIKLKFFCINSIWAFSVAFHLNQLSAPFSANSVIHPAERDLIFSIILDQFVFVSLSPVG